MRVGATFGGKNLSVRKAVGGLTRAVSVDFGGVGRSGVSDLQQDTPGRGLCNVVIYFYLYFRSQVAQVFD